MDKKYFEFDIPVSKLNHSAWNANEVHWRLAGLEQYIFYLVIPINMYRQGRVIGRTIINVWNTLVTMINRYNRRIHTSSYIFIYTRALVSPDREIAWSTDAFFIISWFTFLVTL